MQSLQQQIRFNGNSFGNEYRRCNEGSLYIFCLVCLLLVLRFLFWSVYNPTQKTGTFLNFLKMTI